MGIDQFKAWVEKEEMAKGFLRFIYASTGCSTLDAVIKLIQFYKAIQNVDVEIPIDRRGAYRLSDQLLEGDKPILIGKGSSRFTEGKFKAKLVYVEQGFLVTGDELDIEDRKKGEKNNHDGGEEIRWPFMYERHTGLLFSKAHTELTNTSRKNFILKCINAFQSGKISPYQDKIEIEELSIPNDILSGFGERLQVHTTKEKSDLRSGEKELSSWLEFKGIPLAKKFQVTAWNSIACDTPLKTNMNQRQLTQKVSSWIKCLNQNELDNIADNYSRERKYIIKMERLFPEVVARSKLSQKSNWKLK